MKEVAPPRLLMTTREAATALAVCEKTIWAATKCGDLKCVRLGRAVRYRLQDLEDWIEQHAVNAKEK